MLKPRAPQHTAHKTHIAKTLNEMSMCAFTQDTHITHTPKWDTRDTTELLTSYYRAFAKDICYE